jgi:chemotaxis protein methyltransferase CheR
VSVDDRLLERLLACATSWTGFQREAIRVESLRRVSEQELGAGTTPEELGRSADRFDVPLCERLATAVSVGETFFFRQPEHFEWLVDRITRPPRRRLLRAWSAGCSTGEEAWSLAACLAPHADEVDVIGPDLLARHIEAARRGVYTRQSVREAGPMLYPAVAPDLTVRSELRPLAHFAVHNLLDAPPVDGVDVIFCRNVLVYLRPPAARVAMQHLISALAPGGLIAFAPMDLHEPASGLRADGVGWIK